MTTSNDHLEQTWYKLEFTCNLNETVKQYGYLVKQGFNAMMVDKHILWVASTDERAHFFLALHTNQCTITEFANFKSAVNPPEDS